MMLDLRNSIIEADFVWIDNQFQSNVQISCDVNGDIVDIGQNLNRNDQRPLIRLRNQVYTCR